MIDVSNYQLELPTQQIEDRTNGVIPNLSILLFDFKDLRDDVVFFRSNFQGPNYFDILESLLELQFLLDWTIRELKQHVNERTQSPHHILSTPLKSQTKENKEIIGTDSERMTNLALGLTNLIQTNRKAALESKGEANFLVESLLVDFEKELERSRWVFYMFSKY